MHFKPNGIFSWTPSPDISLAGGPNSTKAVFHNVAARATRLHLDKIIFQHDPNGRRSAVCIISVNMKLVKQRRHAVLSSTAAAILQYVLLHWVARNPKFPSWSLLGHSWFSCS